MTESQKQHWELLLEIDDQGRRLTRDEINFVAGLIDGDRRGHLTSGEMNKIRALHQKKVQGVLDDDDDL